MFHKGNKQINKGKKKANRLVSVTLTQVQKKCMYENSMSLKYLD